MTKISRGKPNAINEKKNWRKKTKTKIENQNKKNSNRKIVEWIVGRKIVDFENRLNLSMKIEFFAFSFAQRDSYFHFSFVRQMSIS